MAAPSKITHLSSLSQLSTLSQRNTYIVIDFHATWCGPCKTIAPVFESLALIHSKPGKLAFAKCDTDANQDIARKYDVSAMPTFVLLSAEKVIDSLRGADPSALRKLVLDAAGRADRAASATFAFGGKGNVLGNAPPAAASASGNVKGDGKTASSSRTTATTAAGARAHSNNGGQAWSITTFLDNIQQTINPFLQRGGDSWYITLIRFFMLYLTTLLSLDPVASAEASPYRTAGR